MKQNKESFLKHEGRKKELTHIRQQLQDNKKSADEIKMFLTSDVFSYLI